MKNIRYLVIGLVVLLTMISTVSAIDIWSGDVFSRDGGSGAIGAQVTTPPLPEGAECTVTVTEIFWYNYAANLRADAQCYQQVEGGAFIPAPDGHSFLQLGTGEPEDVYWGPCNNVWPREYTYNLLGKGLPLNIRIYDWIDGGVTNNNCHLPVTVSCEERTSVPEFPSVFLPATMIIGFLGAVLFIKRTKEH